MLSHQKLCKLTASLIFHKCDDRKSAHATVCDSQNLDLRWDRLANGKDTSDDVTGKRSKVSRQKTTSRYQGGIQKWYQGGTQNGKRTPRITHTNRHPFSQAQQLSHFNSQPFTALLAVWHSNPKTGEKNQLTQFAYLKQSLFQEDGAMQKSSPSLVGRNGNGEVFGCCET